MLAEVKATLVHGAWMPWLRANAGVLNFTSRFTAAKLMKFASNVPSTAHIEMLEISELRALDSQLWNNKKSSGPSTASVIKTQSHH